MRVLFLGDIVGKAGRFVIQQELKKQILKSLDNEIRIKNLNYILRMNTLMH